MVPDPRLGINGLADRPEQAQRVEVVLVDELAPRAHESADGRRRRVEDGNPVPLDHLPEPRVVREVGRALVHEHRRAVGHRPVDDVAVAGDPADVGGAPIDVLVAKVEDVVRRQVRPEHVPAGGVDDALGLPGGPAGVEDEQQVLGVHRLRFAVGGLFPHQLVPPHVPPLDPVNRCGRRSRGSRGVADALEHDHFFHQVRPLQRLVHVVLQGNDVSAPKAPVGRDDEVRFGVLDAVGDGLAAESAEDDRVRRAEPRAGEDRDDRLGHHRHVDGDAVALLHAQGLQTVGKPAHVVAKLPVGDAVDRPAAARPAALGLAFPQDRRLVAAPALHLQVEAVVGKVGLAADEPLRVRRFPFEHPVPLFEPVQLLGHLAPEALGLFDRLAIHPVVIGAGADVGLGREIARGVEDPVLLQRRLDGRLVLRHDLPLRSDCLSAQATAVYPTRRGFGLTRRLSRRYFSTVAPGLRARIASAADRRHRK